MSTKAEPGQFDCYKKLGIDEPYFVIRAKDPVGPDTVVFWVNARAKTPGNTDNPKLQEALACAASMRAWRVRAMTGKACGCDPAVDHLCDRCSDPQIQSMRKMIAEARAEVRDEVYAQLQEIMVFVAAVELAIGGDVGIADARDAISRKAVEIFTRESGRADVI